MTVPMYRYLWSNGLVTTEDNTVLVTTGDKDVSLEFYADSKLLNFMGINDSLSWLTITLRANQLEELAELILDSAANCK